MNQSFDLANGFSQEYRSVESAVLLEDEVLSE